MLSTGKPAHRMFRFSHRTSDGWLYWESIGRLPGDSRHEQVRCRADWFWHSRP